MTKPAEQFRNAVQQAHPGATVHGRGRNWIRHQHPSDPNKFILDTSIGSIHYGPLNDQEIDTAFVNGDPVLDAPWQKKMTVNDFHVFFGPGTQEFDAGQIIKYVDPDTGSEVTFQPQALEWTNDLDQIQQISIPQKITPTINDDTLTFANAFGSGLNFRWQVQTARLAKFLDIASLASLPAPNATILAGGNPVLRLQFIFQKSAGVDIYIDGQLWDERANNPKTTSGDVEFRSGGTTLWWFKQAWANDQNGDAPTVVQRFRKQGPNLLVSVRVPWSWLQSAVYPVTIDPTIDKVIAAGADDAHEYANDTGFDGTGTTVNVDAHTTAAQASLGGFRFTGLGALNGSTVSVCYISITPSNGSVDDPTLDIHMERANNPVNFTTNADVVNRTKTTAKVAWVAVGIGAGSLVNSPDFTSVCQEWVDNHTISDAGMVIMVGRTSDILKLRVRSYEADTVKCGNFHVEYTTGAATLSISVSDTIALSETVTATVSAPQVSVSDSISLADSPTARLQSFVSVSDTVALSDNAQAALVNLISVLDTISLSDNAAARLQSFITALDTISLSDNAQALIESYITALDTITLADSPTVSVVEAGAIAINVTDTIALSETVSVAISAPQVSVLDTIAISDNVTVSVIDAGAIAINVTDTIALSDNAAALVEALISVSDTVALSETVQTALENFITALDTVAITDAPTISIGEAGAIQINVDDTITLADNAQAAVSDPQVSVTDTISLSDNVTVSIEAVGALSITVTDTIALSDAPTARIESNISVSDTLALSETVSLLLPQLYVTTSDTLAISSSPTVAVTPLFVSVSDSIAVSDTITVSVPAAIIALVFLTVAARSTNLTLSNRSLTLTLEDR